jgi:hypothetical protein
MRPLKPGRAGNHPAPLLYVPLVNLSPNRAKESAMAWQRRFDDPIPLPCGRQLRIADGGSCHGIGETMICLAAMELEGVALEEI